jgi:hypothetical protein
LGIVLAVCIASSIGPSPCRGNEKTVFHRKTKTTTTGTIVGRIPGASAPPERGFPFAISNPFQLKPETTVDLYSPPTNGQRKRLATVKPDKHGRFTFTRVLPGNDYTIHAKSGLGVKAFSGDREGISVVVAQTTDVGDIELSK